MINLIVTQGTGSLDKYSQELAKYVKASIIRTDIYQSVVEKFNIPWMSLDALRIVLRDYQFVRFLNSLEGIIHLPNHHMGRYGLFLNKPFIITVHDVIRYLDMTSPSNGVLIHRPNGRDRYYLRLDYNGVRRAAKIIAVSHYTKQEIIDKLHIDGRRITVIYEGVDHEVFKPLKAHPPIHEPYILYVGSEHPRKNLKGLLIAFKRLKGDSRFRDLKLVKVGEAGGREHDFRADTKRLIKSLDLERDVIFTGYIPEEVLAQYYSAAECYVCPSLYEGFGFTVLEAMACGCPVITSNITSMPEIAGDAAILIEPGDPSSLADAMKCVLTNDVIRQELRERGIRRAANFNWRKTGEETMKIYAEVEDSSYLHNN